MLTFDRHILVTSVYLFLSYCCVVCDVLTYLLSLVALVSWFPILHRLLVIFFSWTTVNATIRKFRIGPSLSNRDVQFEFESNLEASQVPSYKFIRKMLIPSLVVLHYRKLHHQIDPALQHLLRLHQLYLTN